jgi:acetyl esterase/lipase
MATIVQEFTAEDIEYLRHGDQGLNLRLFRPVGDGPFPLIVDLHGGAWCNGDLTDCVPRDEVLVKAGMAVAALDFRHAGDGYPASAIDINYAIRWLKAHAEEFNLDPDRVGISGQSSGGHLAMLCAMRPHDPRYTSIELDGPVDATVKCAGLSWPVINPLSRYRHALRAREEAGPPKWVGDIPERHDLYWGTELKMEEGNPLLALERGEPLELPPALWVQGTPDIVHDYRDTPSGEDVNEPERFVRNYRAAGGEIELVLVEQSDRSAQSFDPLAAFFVKYL